MIARELVGFPPYSLEVEDGLTRHPKSLPAKLFYDQRGSELFEEITRLPEYYVTRTELEILNERSKEIASATGAGVTVVELGAGTAAKTKTLLRAMTATQLRVGYYPVDISRSALMEARERIEAECPSVHTRPIVADFSEGFRFLRDTPGPRIVLYLGSSIGNFDPDAAIAMLTEVRHQLSPGDKLLLGTDMVKSPSVLIPAYDDVQGVTAEFNRNILYRLNHEFGGNFDPDAFAHVAIWNSQESRVEMHLESRKPQLARLGLLGLQISFRTGERIHTENSYKYTMVMVREMLARAGFTLNRTWMDNRRWFGLHLACV